MSQETQPVQEPDFSTQAPRWGFWVLGLVLVAATSLWIAYSEVPARVFISSWCLVIPAVLVLVILVALSYWKRLAITRQEILLVYLMISATSGFAGYAMLHMLLPVVGTAAFYADDSNHYDEVLGWLPQFVKPSSRALVRPLFIGESSPDWLAWLPIAAFWLGFMLVAFCVMLSINLLVWRRWVRRERLSFPLAQIPLELVEKRRGWLTNRTLWIGASIPIALQTLLAFNYWYPAVPAFLLKHEDFAPSLFVNLPWKAVGRFFLKGSPFFFGIAYLAPTDLSFSLWFFMAVRFVVLIGSNILGLDAPFGAHGRAFPFIAESNVGSYAAFGLAALWLVRKDTLDLIRRARAKAPLEEDDRMALFGLWGLGFGLIGLILFGWVLGLPWWLTLVIFGLFLLFGVTLSRARAEAGPPWVFGSRTSTDVVMNTLGTARFEGKSLVGLSSVMWFLADIRSIPMPAQLEGLKLADASGLSRKKTAVALIAATCVALIAGFAATLAASHLYGLSSAKVYGGPRWVGFWANDTAVRWLREGSLPDLSEVTLAIPGAIITWALMLLRTHITWWPLNPIGYVLSNNPTGEVFWFAYFCAWLIKTLIVRYGGIRLYRKTIPFALGIALGDMIIQGFWSALSSIFNLPVYQFIS